jgi:Bacterial Ig-like domain (group 2)/Dockerin type I domain
MIRVAVGCAIWLGVFTISSQGQSLTITSPAAGTVVTAGTSLAITVSSNLPLSMLEIWSAALSGRAASGSATVTVTVPSTPIGPIVLVAVAVSTSGIVVSSAPITIDIEPSTAALALSNAPSTLLFTYPGQQGHIAVTAMLSDGTTVSLTYSSQVTYATNNAQVATVDPKGTVTAQGPGQATITVSNASLISTTSVSISSSGIRGDFDGNGVVDKNDLNIILAALNTPASGPTDARDLNHDGIINALDTRILVTLCNYPGCAVK